jgi:hypothetical protein
MSRRERETEPILSGGSSSGFDGIHTFGGGGSGFGSQSETKNFGNEIGSSAGGGEGAFGETAWFTPIEGTTSPDILNFGGYKDEIYPASWATNPVFAIKDFPKVLEDTINYPTHYTDGGIECIEAIEAQLTKEEFRGYLKGNIAKYIWRERHKGGTESLKKARWYLDRLISSEEI